jgi:mRNA interferase RelE/StbE
VSRYSITFARSARKELERLDEPLISRVFRQIEELADDPRPSGCRKLVGKENLWRIRVGDFRVIYAIYDSEGRVDIVAVRNRKEVYR